jgi:tight adherence protein C
MLFGGAAALMTLQAGRLTSIRARKIRIPFEYWQRRTWLVAAASAVGVLMVWVRPDVVGVALAFLLMYVAWQTPVWRARRQEDARRNSVERELVDALGEMVMCVEAGLTLEAAMNIYANRHSSPLAAEFRAVLDRVALGVSRDDSIAQMLERTPTSGMQMFVAAIRQNQRIGAPLATVLRQQAATARRRRRQAIEEHSAKLAMKMVFPTVLCVLPALMIVVVGPAFIRTLQSLS